MIHRSKFGHYDHQFPTDLDGHVPIAGDHWRDMHYDHEGMNPHEEGISKEEKARRTQYLNTEWWPSVLQHVNDERDRLESEHETFAEHWKRIVDEAPDVPHGFGAG